MHLAVEVGDAAIALDGDGGVVVDAGGAALEQGRDEDDVGFAADAGEGVGGGAGDGLGEAEEGVVFALAEVLGAEELGEADEGGSLACGFVDALGGFVEVEAGVRGAGHLDEGYALVVIRHVDRISFYRVVRDFCGWREGLALEEVFPKKKTAFGAGECSSCFFQAAISDTLEEPENP